LKAKKCLYPLRFASDFPKAPFQKEAKKGNHFEDAGIYIAVLMHGVHGVGLELSISNLYIFILLYIYIIIYYI
jgi:hypothetical protein